MEMASQVDIEDFVSELNSVFGDRLAKVILYGSYARGEATPGSDIDLLLLVKDKKKGDRLKALDIANKFFEERELLFSPRVMEKETFNEKLDKNYGFHKEVAQQGVEI